MKTVFIGDIHGRTIWKDIVDLEHDADKIIFVGDYFDSISISGIEQIANFKEIINFKETSDKEVILLLGNHDHHYLVDEQYTGFQAVLCWDLAYIIRENLKHLQIAYNFDDILCSHAGINPVWLDLHISGWKKETMVNDINDLYKYKPISFNFSHGGYNPYGDHPTQGPLWIRPRSLLASNKGDNGLKKHYIQVVGHTQQTDIYQSFIASKKTMGSKYYLIDCLETKGYLVYKDNIFKPKQLK